MTKAQHARLITETVQALQTHLDKLLMSGDYDSTGFFDKRSGWLELVELADIPYDTPWDTRAAHHEALRCALKAATSLGLIEHRDWGGEYGHLHQWRIIDPRVARSPIR